MKKVQDGNNNLIFQNCFICDISVITIIIQKKKIDIDCDYDFMQMLKQRLPLI